jgi:hypothetical protein
MNSGALEDTPRAAVEAKHAFATLVEVALIAVGSAYRAKSAAVPSPTRVFLMLLYKPTRSI